MSSCDIDKAKNLTSVIFKKKNLESSIKAEQLEWHRSKVVENEN
jgi:hypothetical protein